jgi:WS/DGAT/MGAT family acyltransferase
MAEEIDGFEFEPRMSAADALMWSIEKDPLLRSTITTVMVFDRPPDRARLVARLDRASRLVPRLRQRVVSHAYSIAPPRWEIDPNFDLHYHLRWNRATGDGSLREVFDLAGPIAMQGFDRARPLWEFTVVEDLEDGGAALIAKIHHSITDGVGGIKLMMELLDLERDPEPDPPLPEAPRPERLTETRRLVDALSWTGRRQVGAVAGGLRNLVAGAGRMAGDPGGVVDDALRTAGSMARMVAPAPDPLSPLMRERSLSVHFDALRADLGAMKGASRLVGGKLNDAFVAAVAGGLRRYHDHHGRPVPSLRMTMPVNIRSDRTATLAGNQFAPARFAVPIDIEDPIARMNAVRELVEHVRAEPALALTDAMAEVLNRLPTTATTAVFGSMLKGTDFITSNVPGPPVPVYVAGSRILRQIAFGPMTGAATNVVLLSHMDDLNIGITTDPAAIPDPDVFRAALQDGFDEITKLV